MIAFGEGKPKSTLPVVRWGEVQNKGSLLMNCYYQELFGPRVSGRLLNIGAGTADALFNHRVMLGADEYHTLEPDASIPCTYTASACDAAIVPSDSYDWVISAAVLEHVDDPWAAAREHVRVAKPGGHLLVVLPFGQVMHPAPSFGDYWRFTPQGARQLFAQTKLLEIEVWGEDPACPNGFSVLLQKAPFQNADEKYYWIVHRNAEPFELFDAQKGSSFSWQVRTLHGEPMKVAMELNLARDQHYSQAGLTVSNLEVATRYAEQISKPFGVLGSLDGKSFFERL